ncbi:MAG: TrkA family potassium uptake protein [Actinobacteria bacterium]|nr:TrkA family potassium uptake protein [Actinomycetota bacterium]
MFILIIGAGKVGSNLAMILSEKGHKISLVEKKDAVCSKFAEMKKINVVCGDGCDLLVLQEAGIQAADVVAAVTGDDEDNLVIAQLAKLQPNKPKVVAVVNNPRNDWLYNKKWGIDAAVSHTTVLTKIIEEEICSTC